MSGINRLIARAGQLILGGAPSHGPGSANLPAGAEAWVGNSKLLDPNRLTELTTPEYFTDFVTIGDVSAGDIRKIKPRHLGRTKIAAIGSTVNLIDNSNAEVTLISANIRGGSMGPTGALRATFRSMLLNNSGVGQAATLRVRFAGGMVYEDTTAAIATAALPRALLIDIHVANVGTEGSNLVTGTLIIGNPTAPTSGASSIAAAATLVTAFAGTAGIGTNLDRVLNITWQFANANANLQIQRNNATLELI